MKIANTLKRKHRQKAYDFLLNQGAKTVSEIQDYLLLSQSGTSQILADLLKSKLVKNSREGKFVYYSISDNMQLFEQLLNKVKDAEAEYIKAAN